MTFLVAVAELDGLIEDARSRVRGPEILRFSSTLFSRALVPTGARCYHIYSSRATIFYFSDTVHFLARSLTYEMLRWAVFTDHYFIPDLSLNFQQKVTMVSTFIYITFKPSLTCCIINYKESSIDLFSKWLHWIYDFT